MSPQVLITIVLSLGLIAVILGLSWWLIRMSKQESKTFKGIPKEAENWIKAKSVLSWISLLALLVLFFSPSEGMAGIFLILLGVYYICYGAAVYKAEVIRPLGFGISYYGKAAKVVGVMIGLFGATIFIFGLGGLILA